MFGLRGTELLLILVVLLLLFGATRLPQLGSSLGSAIRNFKKGFGGEEPEADAQKGAGGTLAASTRADVKPEATKVPASRDS